MLTVQDAVERFFNELRLSPRSKKTYRLGIQKFLLDLCNQQGLDPTSAPVTALTEDHVVAFLTRLLPDDIRAPEEVSQMRTAQTTLAAVRKFYRYLIAYDLHPGVSTEKLRERIATIMPRFTPPPPDVKQRDLERIVDYVRHFPPVANPIQELRQRKLRALVLFLYRTGVRVSELCALRRRDIDIELGTAHVYRAKGGKSRTVHFDSETAEALVAYWQARGDRGPSAGDLPAFSGRDRPGRAGRAISPRTVEHLIRQLAETVGVEHAVTPHSFRHGLATELVRRRVRESTVQAILGHASPVTTRVYVHKTAVEIAQEYYEAFGQYHRPE